MPVLPNKQTIWIYRLVGCWSFTSWQRLESYHDGFWFVMVHTHGEFIVLTNWEIIIIWYPTQSHYPVTEPTSPCLTLIMLSAWLGSDTHTFLSNLFDSIEEFASTDLQKWEKYMMYSFSHHVWSTIRIYMCPNCLYTCAHVYTHAH